MKYCLIVLQILICIVPPALSQQYITQTKTYGIEDGLIDHNVFAIMESRDGFVWIGSPIGLLRFDGYVFKPYTKANSGLSNYQTDNIAQDPEGNLWLFSNKSRMESEIDIFNPVSGKVMPLVQKLTGSLPGVVPVFTGFYAQDAAGTFYLGTRDTRGILKYNPASGFQWVKLTNQGTFQPLFCTGFATVWGYLFPGVNNSENTLPKLVEYDFKGNILHDLGTVTPKIPTSGRYVDSGDFFYEKKGDDNIVRTYLYDHQQGSPALNPVCILKREPSHAAPLAVYLDNGRLFACDTKVIETATGKTVLDLTREIPEINDFGINAWRVDHGGKLWIGTDFGLAIIDIQPSKFKTWLFNGDNTKMGISIRGILPVSDNNVLVNTEGNGQWNINNQTGKTFRTAEDIRLFSYGIGKDNAGNIYYSSSDNDLVQLSGTGAARHFSGTGKNAACFYHDPANRRLWIGTRGQGLVFFNNETNQIIPYTQYNSFNELAAANIFFIEKDREGFLWISTDKGLYQLDTGKGITGRYWSGGKGRFYMPHDFFVHSYIDKNDIYWLVTYGGGLLRWDKKNNIVRHFGLESGFLTEFNYAVYEDEHDHLWIPGYYGITQFDKTNEEVRKIYSTYDGLTNQEFNATSHAKGPDGTLYFGGLNGMTSFHSDDFYDTTRQHRVPLVLTGCRQYDATLGKSNDITRQVLYNNSITLDPGNRFFTIDLALLSYEELPEVRYAYRFDDEKKWIFHNGRTLDFGNLSYGRHTLHLSAITAKGSRSANELILTIIQQKPLYLKIWFIAIVVMFILGVFAAYLRWQTYRLKANQRLLEGKIRTATAHIQQQAAQLIQMDEVKSRFFANISHELRTPLTLIIGPINTIMKSHQVENRDFNLLKMAQQQGKLLLKLVNQLLDLTKLESGKLELKESAVPFYVFMNRIFASFESQTDQQQQHFTLQYKADKNLRLWLDAPKLETILYNLLSNAIKFTPAGENIQLIAEEVAGNIRITVSDSGRGIHPEDLPRVFERFYQSNQPGTPIEGGTGIGLALCRELANLMGGSIVAASPNPEFTDKGAVFYVEFPCVIAPATDLSEQSPLPENMAFTDSSLSVDSSVETKTGKSAPAFDQQQILVVEDNNDLREYLELILSDRFMVTSMQNGQQALDYLLSLAPGHLPDLVLTDIMMPVMDGFQLLEKLRENNQFRALPVVLLTARADIQDKLRALRIGVDDYLLKPFEEEELIARIDNLLKNYAIRMEMRSLLEEKQVEPALENEPEILPPPATEAERQWLESLEKIVKNNIGNNMFSANFLAEQVGLSHRQVQRRMIALTGLTLHDYISEIRMCEARRLLESDSIVNIKDLAAAVGFSSRKYFSSLFKSRFGKMPSAYLQNTENTDN